MISDHSPLIACFLLGLSASFHPCPFTTNIAAITYLTGWSFKEKDSKKHVILFIFSYILTFILIGIIISFSLSKIPRFSITLQSIMKVLLGPILIITGMLHAGLLNSLNKYQIGIQNWLESKIKSKPQIMLMGSLLALSFCPATAALFFGLLLPMSISQNQFLIYPLIYGLGAALPLIMISYFIFKSKEVLKSDKWKQHIPIMTGYTLIIIGIYFIVTNIYL